MKSKYIEQIYQYNEGDVFQDFFMIKDISLKYGATQKAYLDIQLGDKTGEINGKKWDVFPEDEELLENLKAGDIVKIRSNINIWNGIYQLKVTKIRKSIPNDNLDVADFVRTAPESSEDMFKFIYDKVMEFKDDDLKRLCKMVLDRDREKLLYYPAATKNHHALYGGLLWHIKRMILAGDGLCNVYDYLDRDLLITGVIFHDLEKIREIDSNEMGIASNYTIEGNLIGHLVMGVRQLEEDMKYLGIDAEKRLLVEHMVLTHHYEPEYGSPKRPMFPEAEILHYLDVMDAVMYDMQEALLKTEEGSFSDKIWTLNNRMIYKRKVERDD